MQLYAFNDQRELILARNAKSKVDYFCLECNGVVRTRKGNLRKAHFYHINHKAKCSQQSKSLTHIALQEYLFELLPNSVLEKRFPEIKRIADVVWFEHNLVFEIQCSPIDQEEILSRCQDYQSIGFETIWILHDKRYNKWRHSLAEKALLGRPRYFTNFNQHGKGIIYDQFEIVQNGMRKVRFPPLQVDLSQPFRSPHLSFQGDFLYHSQEKTTYFLRAEQEERKHSAKPLKFNPFCFVRDLYMRWLDNRLEKCAINHDII